MMAAQLTERRIDWIGILFAIALTLVIVLPLVVVGTWAFANVWRFPASGPRLWPAPMFGTPSP